MDSAVQLINEVGFPIAAALGLGLFIWKLINRIIDGLETKVDTLDDKLVEQINHLEERLGSKLDAQHGILVGLIDRVRSVDNEIIRQDTLLKTILGVPQLMQSDRLAKADRDDQRKD
jgi:hypothetical protein